MAARNLDDPSLASEGFSRDDISKLTELSYRLISEGLAGACVRAHLVDGQQMVTILNFDNDDILFGFGKNQRGYYVFDWEGRPVIEGCSCLDEILAVLC